MRELSLHLLDICENSVKAGASLVEIGVRASPEEDRLTLTVTDDGCGMSKEFLARVTDPFTTTRTTRKVGMGIPLFQMAAETAGGSFEIQSEVGRGTRVRAAFQLSHIDRAPLGNLPDTLCALLSDSTTNAGKQVDFLLDYAVGDRSFRFDTRELRAELGEGIPLDEPEILNFVRNLLEENIIEINGGAEI